ncbi:type II toxin-antitoxin system RelE family toxin [Levilactobacillus paucivorans]|uniref:type II toxin-antitoxin system RelE family toxin n=1 Tax=Levilactobacillus paucivorans TaxID=616990 RepID=UPI000708A60B|nr:type II toxin-antitoxin system RelE/ParE family toxin [Levilactobacillus paucivorans]
MSNYDVRTSRSFRDALKKLDKGTQRTLAKWISKHLIGVDFPSSPGKKLVGNYAGYVRFRVGSYRIIAIVNDHELIITAVFVAKREIVYEQSWQNDK